MLEIYKEIGTIEKQGKNQGQNYNYFTESQIASKLQDLFLKNGIAVFTSTESYEVQSYPRLKDGVTVGTQFITHVKTAHHLVDADSGESITIYSCGSGADTGDKGMYKAITGSFKYFMMKNAFVSDNQDPENDAEEARERAESIAKKKKTAAPLEPETTDSELSKYFDQKDWSEVTFHFGKLSGTRLSEMSEKDLKWWSENWIPKKINGQYSDANLKLYAALQQWKRTWNT